MKTKKKEREDTRRVQLPGKIRILQLASTGAEPESITESIWLKNVSVGGLCAVSDRELPPGTVMELEVSIENQIQKQFKAFCLAVWTKKNPENGFYATGMKFLAIKQSDVKMIEEIAEEEKSKHLINAGFEPAVYN